MLVVFVIDTSASMNQRCNNGLTLLDCAKSAVEQFHKVRLRDASARNDKYMLVTCENGPNAIKVIDKYPFSTFLQAVKGIQAHDLTSIDASLQQVFNFLHLQRMALDTDKIGHGRNPCSIDPTTLLLLTDGTDLTSMSGVLSDLSIPRSTSLIGADLFMQPFRWDQRIFATVLRIPAVNGPVFEKDLHSIHAMDSTISRLCESTGGKCFVAANWKSLMQHMEVTAVRLVPSVVVSFEQLPSPLGSTVVPQAVVSFKNKVIYVRFGQLQGFWPIPESFLPDSAHPELLPREAHPVICYKPVETDPFIPPNFIYDKYEIENIPFLSLSNKISKGFCWQVFIRNSKGIHNGIGDPFGFIRLNQGGALSLFVLPYNYPVLWQLLKQVMKMSGSSMAKIPPGSQWRLEMENYCMSIPPYYGPALRIALKKWGIHAQVVPESMDSGWFTFIGSCNRRIKAQAKPEYDALNSQILAEDQCTLKLPNLHKQERLLKSYNQVSSTSAEIIGSYAPTDGGILTPPVQGPMDATTKLGGLNNVGNLPNGKNSSVVDSVFKNPFGVARDQLIRQIITLPARVAASFHSRRNNTSTSVFKTESAYSLLADKIATKEAFEARHSVPIEKMGDFSEALLKEQPPRNPYMEDIERTKQQKHMFGNPYRQERSEGAEETWQEGMNGPLSRGRKKRRRVELLGTQPSQPSDSFDGAPLSPEVLPPNDGLSKVARTATVPAANDATLYPMDISVDYMNPPHVEGNFSEQVPGSCNNKSPADNCTINSPGLTSVTSLTDENKAATLRFKDTHDVAKFLISVIKTLRHTRAGNTQKLFDILSIPDFPVEKSSFVRELIQQAHRYNKGPVAEELSHYHSELCKGGSGNV